MIFQTRSSIMRKIKRTNSSIKGHNYIILILNPKKLFFLRFSIIRNVFYNITEIAVKD